MLGDLEDLEDWELEDPELCRLRDNVLRLGEEKREMLQQLEDTHAMIAALDESMSKTRKGIVSGT